ncbi:MAG: nucleoside hydrolase [Rhodospirillaceae bacterium]|nr:nucleoside hydrolase [Rhodospirillaceae bacterium]
MWYRVTQKLIIDTDPGIDDAMAIHLAFADSRINVIGMTTIFGNVTTAQATRNALYLAEMAHYDLPVAKGATVPRHRNGAPPADFVHGSEGFGDLPAMQPAGKPDSRNAARFLCESCAAHPGEVIICAVGPLTNLAAALDHDTSITQTVKRVVVMGGSAARHGNVSDCAEANIWNDPDAADAVFGADWDVTMVGLDVTEKTQCTPANFAKLAEAAPIIGGFLEKASRFYFDFHEAKTGKRSCFMHDPSAIIAVTDPDLFGYERHPITVVCSGNEIGRTVTNPKADRRGTQIAMTVDSRTVGEIFMRYVAAADDMADAREKMA